MTEQSRECTGCHQTKSLDEFSRRASGRYGRNSRCKECEKKRVRQYYKDNPDKAREVNKRKYWKDPDAARANARQYYRENQQVLVRNARQKRAEDPDYIQQYRREKPHVSWRNTYAHRARAAGFDVVIGEFTKQDVIRTYGDACVYCGGPFQQLDHYVPISTGGTHVLSNVRPSCRKCNRAKSDQCPESSPYAREHDHDDI